MRHIKQNNPELEAKGWLHAFIALLSLATLIGCGEVAVQTDSTNRRTVTVEIDEDLMNQGDEKKSEDAVVEDPIQGKTHPTVKDPMGVDDDSNMPNSDDSNNDNTVDSNPNVNDPKQPVDNVVEVKTDCKDTEKLLIEKVLNPLTDSNCLACHNRSGPGKDTSLQLDDAIDIADKKMMIESLINWENPTESKILTKPTNKVSHLGGAIIKENDNTYQSILAYIDHIRKNGCHLDSNETVKTVSCDESAADNAVLPRRVVRLTQVQYNNTLNAIFDFNVEDIKATLNDEDPTIGMSSNFNSLQFNEIIGESAFNASWKIAERAMNSYPLVARCRNNPNKNCVTGMIRDLARALWFKPAESQVVTELEAKFQMLRNTSGFQYNDAMQVVMTSMLLSPHFWFRTELGAKKAGDVFELDQYEIAKYISYTLTNSPPPAFLMTMADNGQLTSKDTYQNAVNQLLNTDEAKTQFENYMVDLLKVDRIFGLKKDFQYDFDDEFKILLNQSFRRTSRSIFESGTPTLQNLMSSTNAFVNKRISAAFNFDGNQANVDLKMENLPADTRKGILSHPAFQAVFAEEHNSNIVKRGVFALEQLACYKIPLPPANVQPNPNVPEGFNPEMETSRRVLEVLHSSQPTCQGCHSKIDPVGAAFENFDHVGRFRLTEKGGLSIDSSGAIQGIENMEISYQNSVDFIDKFTASKRFKDCFSTRFFEYHTGYDSREQTCSAREFSKASEGNNHQLVDMYQKLLSFDNAILRKVKGE